MTRNEPPPGSVVHTPDGIWYVHMWLPKRHIFGKRGVNKPWMVLGQPFGDDRWTTWDEMQPLPDDSTLMLEGK